MATWAESVAPLVTAVAKVNGRYDERTPKLKASDMISMLGNFSRHLPSQITRIASAGVLPSSTVTDEGTPAGGLSAFIVPMNPSDYLFHSTAPDSKTAWRRIPGDSTIASAPIPATWEPARERSLIRNDQLELLTFLRQSINDYQRASDQITFSLIMSGTVASEAASKSFMSALRAFASDLDVLQTNPPTTLAEDIKGGAKAAAAASAEATTKIAEAGGNAAGFVANQIGKAAGAAASGFLDSANITTLLVGSLIGYVALRRYL